MINKADNSLKDLLRMAYCRGKYWDEYQAEGSTYEFDDWYAETESSLLLVLKDLLKSAFEAGTHMVVGTMNQAHAIDFEEYYAELKQQ